MKYIVLKFIADLLGTAYAILVPSAFFWWAYRPDDGMFLHAFAAFASLYVFKFCVQANEKSQQHVNKYLSE